MGMPFTVNPAFIPKSVNCSAVYRLYPNLELFAAVLVYRGSRPYKEFCDVGIAVRMLMGALEVDLFVLGEDGRDVVEARYSEEM